MTLNIVFFFALPSILLLMWSERDLYCLIVHVIVTRLHIESYVASLYCQQMWSFTLNLYHGPLFSRHKRNKLQVHNELQVEVECCVIEVVCCALCHRHREETSRQKWSVTMVSEPSTVLVHISLHLFQNVRIHRHVTESSHLIALHVTQAGRDIAT